MMQKQRSPYTGAGFNLQQLKATNFGKNETLNGMPFLKQLAQQVQQCPKGHQHMASPPAHMRGDPGHERGLRSGTPRSYIKGGYEGEMMPPLSMGVANASLPLPDDCLHRAKGQLGQFEQLAEPEPIKARKGYQSDTDSETEYCQHMQCFEPGIGKSSRWHRFFNYLKAGMPPQRQERMDAALQRCCENTFFNHVLLVLQLFSILIGGAIKQSVRFCMNATQMSFRLWRCKFQLRSLMRIILWRMANAKGNDALVFLGVMLMSPWLFLISLIGFAIAFVFQLKEGLGATLRQVRLQVLN